MPDAALERAQKPAIRAEAARLSALFLEAGAVPVEADILQPAGTLLDLYGEDVRARAFVTSDPLRGEVMLRPDFTVPVVLEHLRKGDAPQRLTYAGEVFRRQEEDDTRAAEFLQVGFESFHAADPAAADAEVFARIQRALDGLPLRAAMGDIGLLRSAVMGLETSARRRAALLRHLWRPRRFRALLDRFGGRSEVPPHRRELLSALEGQRAEDLIAAAGTPVGKRSVADIQERLDALVEDADTPPLDAGALALIDDLLTLRETPGYALERLRDLAVDLPAIAPAVERLAARLTALEAEGVDLDSIAFEASYGRSSLEYYDGFVFGFYAEGRPDLPALASGGRYDALTQALGTPAPAVGGVIRPGLALGLREGLI